MIKQSGDILYLGSQSRSRQELLTAAGIPFCVVTHTSTERDVPYQGNSDAYVIAVAEDKMQHLVLPALDEVAQDFLFVVTADTMIQIVRTGELFGKPDNYAHALAMLAAMYQEPVRVVTGTCMQKMQRGVSSWQLLAKEHYATGALVEFDVHPHEREEYLAHLPEALYCCGAGIVEGFGFNYVKSVAGSYAAVIGLPIFELRESLRQHGFVFPRLV